MALNDAVDGEALFLEEAFLQRHRIGQRVEEDAVLADGEPLGGGGGERGGCGEAREHGAKGEAHFFLPLMGFGSCAALAACGARIGENLTRGPRDFKLFLRNQRMRGAEASAVPEVAP